MASLSGSTAGTGVTKSQLAEIIRAIRKCPIIDNHAHPLLKPEALTKHPLISITTEAAGDAIHATHTSLAHIRGVKQLAHLLDCGQTWEAVVAAIEQRRIEDYEDWVSECLDGIETILVDDGLDAVDDVHDYEWHNSFTRSGCKRIVRIETIAGRIIHKHALEFKDGDSSEDVFDKVFAEFDLAIRDAIADPEVVGFKSVICYRTGLDIPAVVDVALAKASFDEIVTNYAGPADSASSARLQHPGLNDLVVHHAAGLISELPSRERKPIQFHTGLGDNDITLTKSSPSHLQEFIRTYPTVPIVLLHAGYPFTRELGYLATVYTNVYAVCEIHPRCSSGAMQAIHTCHETGTHTNSSYDRTLVKYSPLLAVMVKRKRFGRYSSSVPGPKFFGALTVGHRAESELRDKSRFISNYHNCKATGFRRRTFSPLYK